MPPKRPPPPSLRLTVCSNSHRVALEALRGDCDQSFAGLSAAKNRLGKSGVYVIKNTRTGRCYVGSSVNVGRRLHFHRWRLLKGQHRCAALQAAWATDGSCSFQFEIIEWAEGADLLTREQHWINALRSAQEGYNRSPSAGSNKGLKLSEETRCRLSEMARQQMQNPATKRRHAEGVARAMSKPEIRKRMSDAAKVRYSNPEAKEAQRKATHSPEAEARRVETLSKTLAERTLIETPEEKQARTKKYRNSQGTYAVIFPNGQEKTIVCLKDFCKEVGISYHRAMQYLKLCKKGLTAKDVDGYQFRRIA